MLVLTSNLSVSLGSMKIIPIKAHDNFSIQVAISEKGLGDCYHVSGGWGGCDSKILDKL